MVPWLKAVIANRPRGLLLIVVLLTLMMLILSSFSLVMAFTFRADSKGREQYWRGAFSQVRARSIAELEERKLNTERLDRLQLQVAEINGSLKTLSAIMGARLAQENEQR